MIKGKCCIFGGGSLYRLPIYNLLAKCIDCDYYIGEDPDSKGIKSYNYDDLSNYKGVIKHKYVFGNFFWQKGALKLWREPYEYYFVGGAFCLTSWIMLLLSFFSEKKVVSWSHGMYGRENGLRKWVKILFFKLCYHCLVYNQRGKDLLVACGVDKDKVFVVYNSLDTKADLAVRSQLTSSPIYNAIFKNDNPVAIFVGRVTKEKRLDIAIKSLALLKKKGKPVNFVVVGKDVDGVNLKQLASEVGLDDNLYLYGPCYDGNRIGELFFNANVCVSPGNVGLTAISSLTFGCPVITHNNFSYQGPEFEAIQPGITGDFFNQGDYEDLAIKIEEWTYKKKGTNRQTIRLNAYAEIDRKWNVYSEMEIFKRLFGNED